MCPLIQVKRSMSSFFLENYSGTSKTLRSKPRGNWQAIFLGRILGLIRWSVPSHKNRVTDSVKHRAVAV